MFTKISERIILIPIVLIFLNGCATGPKTVQIFYVGKNENTEVKYLIDKRPSEEIEPVASFNPFNPASAISPERFEPDPMFALETEIMKVLGEDIKNRKITIEHFQFADVQNRQMKKALAAGFAAASWILAQYMWDQADKNDDIVTCRIAGKVEDTPFDVYRYAIYSTLKPEYYQDSLRWVVKRVIRETAEKIKEILDETGNGSDLKMDKSDEK